MKTSALLLFPLVMIAAASARDLGNLVFIGDSITHGGNGNPSYRYQVWKTLVDNGAKFTFVGSQTGAHHHNAVNAPDYRNATFANVHDGHWGWRASWESGAVPIPGGREHTANLGHGTLANWLGLTPTYLNHAGTNNYEGKTYVPDTAVILLGVNDISSPSGGALRGAEQVVGDLHTMVEQLQRANPKVRVLVSSILPSSALNGHQENTRVAINKSLAESAAGWSRGKSQVTFVNSAEGFLPGSMTYDRTHPNAMGEMHIGGKLSEALGLAPRNLGLEIQPAAKFSTYADFTRMPGTEAGPQPYRGGNTDGISPGKEPGSLAIRSGRQDAYLRADWNLASGQNHSVTTQVRILPDEDAQNNLVIWVDDGPGGAPAGFLRIHPDRISWGLNRETVLYHADNTKAFHEYRIVYDGKGYSVWRDKLLIAENLGNAGVSVEQNHLFVGNHSSSQSTSAEIKSLGYHKGAAFAPIPEPSAYGLMGATALGGLVWLRRRQKKRVA